ncbi:MAG: phytanoyl-CoA dioxygenase family protein [Devosia sp.]|uniref:phytanoyl-CoA dioxygenase family protein n=1 Tax=Devosia sp. TaxID=1871048 RepID=UPI0019E1C8F7|nr:phytanoyl-CoA dioxygenase family protein [Devosia sp.]MBF0677790.1 phytanoyl-CoA dioxygenase family protein [Devosia sp.]
MTPKRGAGFGMEDGLVEGAPCTDLERYMFDLNGFLVLRNALSRDEVAACNELLDEVDGFVGDGWHGKVKLYNDTSRQEGLVLQQVYEGGPTWESLIDHPSWFRQAVHFIGSDDPENFDGHHGPAFIDECFASVRGPGQALRLHSGGHVGTIRTQYRFHAGKFHCGQVNVLIALNDIGPGDGATMVIPGSHKSNLRHPQTVALDKRDEPSSVDGVAGAVEVHLKAGDALMFVDAIMHGAARRTNPGHRRMTVYRYGPSWGYFRHAYVPSPELLARLTPERRRIIMPHKLPAAANG